uniref:Putative reverse transcriptase n=1 Tax=Xenopsylla cheopis TaxID=163159 RepID=A0A6M2DYL2_XENCH
MGPDRVGRNALKRKWVFVILAKLFNVLIAGNIFPAQFRLNRTTLIPKAGKDLTEAKNWRPITISSIISRVFSGIIDARLRSKITLCERQKGFINENGCLANIRILNAVLKHMKAGQGGTIVQIDITKAFDTIPHVSIKEGLLSMGIPPYIADYVFGMYNGVSTTMKVGKDSFNINLLRGVKQGDPLSPLLFNIVMNPLIEHLNGTEFGLKFENAKINVLAFADDIIIVSDSAEGAQSMLNITNAYLQYLGLSIANDKSGTFRIQCKNKSWHIDNPHLKCGDFDLPYIGPERDFEYLGVKFKPWQGLSNNDCCKALIEASQRVRGLKLKPPQKIDLIKQFIIPHYLYILTADVPCQGALEILDCEMRSIYKSILHLPQSTTNGVFYTTIKDGGLGLPRFSNKVRLTALRNGMKLLNTDDITLREALKSECYEEKLVDLSRTLGINWEDRDNINWDALKKESLAEEWKCWSNCASQGQGLRWFRNDKFGNEWLLNKSLLKPGRFIDALRLRTNTFGTRVVLNRAKQDVPLECRECHCAAESLGHVLGACPSLHGHVIRRHNDILDVVTTALEEQGAVDVLKEQSFMVNGDRMKPDLVFCKDGNGFILDVTVRYENGGSLDRARAEKVNKYRKLIPLMLKYYKDKNWKVLPVVIGARGAIPPSTIKALKEIGIFNTQLIRTLSLIAFRSSIEMACQFIGNF